MCGYFKNFVAIGLSGYLVSAVVASLPQYLLLRRPSTGRTLAVRRAWRENMRKT